ncbi:MAG: ABC transporter ATP-binding protein [Candidatus Hydrogenedentes bacterium]|nr:ABC transporter ATP-binding protein [Candidatus Hydrogenedentota bacterium]
MTDTAPLIELRDISKTYDPADPTTAVLQGANLTVTTGETVAIVGPSGCGKSTLLNLAGLLDTPTSGAILFRGDRLDGFDEARRAAFRNSAIGFVFQHHHLLPQCTALENVLVPTLVQRDAGDVADRAAKLLERVGLADRMHARPGQLSGGERQRVAVVRALINRPALLLADEPTGSLSQEGAEALTDLMLELNAEEGMALIVVTHAPDVARKMARIYALAGGALRDEAA